MNFSSDILLIGAGVTGCAIARELSRYHVSVTVLEAGADLAEGATKANSGIVHAGYDALPGTRKALYNVRGASMFPDLCKTLGVPYRQCGALVIAFTPEDEATLSTLLDRGHLNGVHGLSILNRDQVLAMEPNLNSDVRSALFVPSSGIVSPYELAFAMADDAALNGVSFRFNEPVISISRLNNGSFLVKTSSHEYTCGVLINCSGSSGALLHNMISDDQLTMVHRRGQYYLLDRADPLPFSRTVFQCPSVMGKGVLVSPTVHGNLLLGPTAEDIDDPQDTATTREGMNAVLAAVKKTWPDASVRTNITNFSGVRAHLTSDDFVIGPVSGCPHAYEAIGIESPGLSSAPAIGHKLSEEIASSEGYSPKSAIVPFEPLPRPFHEMTDEQKADAVLQDPRNGNIICRCEVVTEAEIRRSIRRPVGARSVDGVKRRTRAGMGRCQGGFCMPRVAAILAEELGIPLLEVTKNGGNSRLLADTVERFLEGGHDHEH